jgi:alkylation response protein AidB-like acyl-CoA dehydrogenase
MIEELSSVTRSVVERGGDLWEALAAADVLAAVVVNDLGMAGHGAVLGELGRGVVAPGYRDGIAVAVEALARFASPALREEWLAPALAGKVRLAVAWHGTGDERILVSEGMAADLFLVAVEGEVLVVPAAGVRREPQAAVDSVAGARDARVVLTGAAPLERLDCLAWARRQRTLAVCAELAGVVRATVDLTARYAREREQFGRPIGAFQAVSQRLADAFIDLRAAELTLAEAVREPGEASVATAAYWAAEAAHRVAHTCVHIHGGTGIDVSHPAHRHFARLKRLEFEVGGATAQLRALGATLG